MSMNNINCVTAEKNKCFGCRACANICPAGAICMKEDEEGFFYPAIDDKKCTNCGLCKKACPSLNKSEVYNSNSDNPDCYAVMANDDIRMKSSSGGAFTLLAEYVLDKGGYVCGVAYTKGSLVQHIIINTKDELDRLRGSKYVQADTNNVYLKIKKLLKDNKLVLFSGTPCQVAGLNTFLGKKYDNLITVDILCHGVPPQKIFDMYLKEAAQGDFINTNFRDKVTGWDVYTTTTTTSGVFSYTKEQCLYLNAFLKNMCLRPSCGSCPFTKIPREADFTIADFWAVERFNEKLNDKFGTSMLLTNSVKAAEIFRIISKTAQLCQNVPIEYAKYYNWTLYRTLPQHPNRKAFFRLLREGKTLREATDYCIANQYDCAIMGVWAYKNYGSSLTSFALQEMIKSLGYTPKIINFILGKAEYQGSFSEKFANKYFDLTKECSNLKDLTTLNYETTTFVVGSDCMWHPPFFKKISSEYIHLFSFAAPDAKKIAYATSFGTYDYRHTSEEKYKLRYYLEKFDKISTREDVGTKLCKDKFGVDADCILDPVFVTDKHKYDELIENSNIEMPEKYIAKYIFWPNKITDKLVDFVTSKYNLPVVDINDKNLISVEDWLKYIKNCNMIITHSFHGMCFAIIFNKPFIIYKIGGFDENRYMSVLRKFGLENKLLVDVSSIENRPDLFEPIDWGKVNAVLAKEKERSLKWLKAALAAPKDLSKINPADAVIQELNDKIRAVTLQPCNAASKEDVVAILNYKRNYYRYLKYKILKNLVFGNLRKKYKEKAKKYHTRVRDVRRLKKGA